MNRKTVYGKLLFLMLLVSLLLGQYTTAQAAAKKTGYAITLNKTAHTLRKGKTVQLKAALNQAAKKKGVEWKSSNPKVASVFKNGKVTAKKNGLPDRPCLPTGALPQTMTEETALDLPAPCGWQQTSFGSMTTAR